MMNHGFEKNVMHDLGLGGFHSRPLAGSQDNNTDILLIHMTSQKKYYGTSPLG
jgi:hypothetical protein